MTHFPAEIKPGEPVLDWPNRKRIALGTARGLEYLHEHCNPKIIQRDVKAANVLLDEDFEAVVGDFGLAKLVDVRKTNVTTQVRGTMGHIAPEYLSTGKSSERTDVFGYGIMLLELVTGQRAIDFSRLEEEDEVLLLDHVSINGCLSFIDHVSSDFASEIFYLAKAIILDMKTNISIASINALEASIVVLTLSLTLIFLRLKTESLEVFLFRLN